MATLASLLVVVGMDTTAMTAGAAKAQGSLAGLGVSAKTMGSVIPLAAAAAGAAVIKFGIDSVRAFEESQRVMAQTEAVLESTGGTAHVTATQVTDFAHTWQEFTGVQDEAIQSSSNLLLTFREVHNEVGKGNDIFNQAQVAILDMATALNRGATPSAEELQSVTIQLGKALNDPIRGMTALRRVGVSFDESQVQMIENLMKTGDLMGAQKVILQELSLEFGGAAKAAGETFSGQLAILRAKFDDLQETIGAALVPALTELVEGLDDLVTVLLAATGAADGFDKKAREAAVGVGQWELNLGGLITKALTGNPIVKSAADIWGAFSDEQEGVGKTTVSTAEKLAALNAVTVEAREGTRDFVTQIPKVAKAFRDTRDALLEEIPALRGVATTYKEAFTLKPQELVHITNSWAKIAKTIAHDLREIADSDLKPKMREAISALPPEMRNAWVEGSAKQRGAIEKSIQTTFNVEDQMPKLARQALTGGTTVGKSMMQGAVAGIVSGSGALDAAARGAVLKAIAAARAAAQAESPSKKMAELGHDMMEGLAQGLLKDEDKLLAVMEKIMSKLQDKLSNMVSKASSFGQGIQGGFSSLFDISGAAEVVAQGGSAVTFFQEKATVARIFAHVLNALGRQGAGKALLSDIAGMGPEGIPFAQGLLQQGPAGIMEINKAYNDIARIAEKTADSLTNRFFGEKLADLRSDVRDQKGVLIDIRQNVKYLEKISDQLSNGDGGNITINAGALLGTREEVMDWIRQGLVAAGRSGKGHH